MKYRIRDIEHFVTTTKCTTIVEAAKLLGIGQPSLSESIKRLEEDCGQTLFYRSRSGIQMTPSGRAFLVTAQKALHALRDLEGASENGSLFGSREISIGCHATVAQYVLPQALAYLKKAAPDFKIELRHDLSRSIQSEIQRGRIDIGIVVNPARVPDLVVKKLGHDSVAVWTAKGDSEIKDTIICNLNLVQTQSILKKWKNKPPKIISTESLELICRLAAEGIGYGIIPARVVQLSNLPLKQIPSLPQFEDEISLVFRPEFGGSLSEKLLIAALKKAF